MVKVRRERPSQRLNHRVSAPVIIECEFGTFKADDWSLGGFRLPAQQRPLENGYEFDCTIKVPFQGFDVSFPMEARVARVGSDGSAGCSFKQVGDREREIMTHFIDELVRGTMTVVDDIILRVDSPVTPVATTPDPNPIEQIPVKRLPLKQIGMVTFYALMGLIVLGYGISSLVVNVFRLEIDTAVVAAPIQPIISTADGKIERAPVDEGLTVRAGLPLFVIEDAKLEEKIEMAKIKVNRLTLQLVAREKALKAEEERLGDYRTVALSKVRQTEARVDSLEKQVRIAENRTNRYRDLLNKGLTTRTKVDDEESTLAALTGQLEDARADAAEQRALLGSVNEGRFFSGGKVEGKISELQADTDFQWDQIMLARDELAALERHKARLTLSAPRAGRVVKILKVEGSSVKSGEQIGLFERDEARTIEAFLTQEEAMEIGLGSSAKVYFPGTDQTIDAVVTAIDRTSGYIDARESAYKWRDPHARTARVTLAFLDLTDQEIRQNFPPGLPAVVSFSREDPTDMKRRVGQMVEADDLSARPDEEAI